MSRFKVGDKVRLIEHPATWHYHTKKLLSVGTEVTIRAIHRTELVDVYCIAFDRRMAVWLPDFCLAPVDNKRYKFTVRRIEV